MLQKVAKLASFAVCAVLCGLLIYLQLSAQAPLRVNRPREWFAALNAIRFADQFPGATVTNQIDACLADAGPFVDAACVIPPFLGPGLASSRTNRQVLLDLRSGFAKLGAGVFNRTSAYAGDGAGSLVQIIKGDDANPSSDGDAALIVGKVSTSPVSGSFRNSALYAYGKLLVTGVNAHVIGVHGHVEDRIGGLQTFVEGGRFGATLFSSTDDGAGFGVVLSAVTDTGIGFENLTGAEADIRNNSGTNPGPSYDTSSPSFISQGFIAGCRGTNSCDAGFVLNPFGENSFREGFLVPDGAAAQVVVTDAAFRSDDQTVFGLDLYGYGNATQTFAIRIPNNTPIGARNFADDANHNIIAYTVSDVLNLGTNAVAVLSVAPFRFPSVLFAALGTPTDGQSVYCSDCLRGSVPCTGSSTGSKAFRENGAWNCD